ncbi:hypothetical protein, partial [Amycolatopsis sp. NPDC059021]|uniref:hypothetical protein n=1 Tax=Amycolatopsis sp. NPDC059021 TaxID=3346704 RepID=UPI00366F1014
MKDFLEARGLSTDKHGGRFKNSLLGDLVREWVLGIPVDIGQHKVAELSGGLIHYGTVSRIRIKARRDAAGETGESAGLPSTRPTGRSSDAAGDGSPVLTGSDVRRLRLKKAKIDGRPDAAEDFVAGVDAPVRTVSEGASGAAGDTPVADSAVRTGGGTEESPEKTAEYIREHVPDYVRHNRAAGSTTVNKTLVQVSLEDLLARLLPGVRWKNLDALQAQLDVKPQQFVGEGKRLTLTTVEGEIYELKLRTGFGIDDPGLKPLKESKTNATTLKSKDKHEVSGNDGVFHDNSVGFTVSSMTPVGPMVIATPRLQISPDQPQDTRLKAEFGNSYQVDLGAMHTVEAPMWVVASLRDESDRVVTSEHSGPGGEVRGVGMVNVSVPIERAVTPDPAPAVLAVARDGVPGLAIKLADQAALAEQGIHRLEPDAKLPSKYAPEIVVVHNAPSSKDFFGQVVDQLRAQYGEKYDKVFAVGSYGRELLQQFLGEENLLAELRRESANEAYPHAEAGWFRSPPLYKGRNARGFEFFTRVTQLEARLVPKYYVVGDGAKREITDTDRAHLENSDEKAVSRKWGLELGVGVGANILPPVVKLFGGASFGTSKGKTHGRASTRSTAVKNALAGKEDVKDVQVVYELQVRPIGEKGRPLHGAVTAQLSAPAGQVDRIGKPGMESGEEFRSGDDRVRYGPSEMEHRKYVPGRVEGVSQDDTTWFYETIVPMLRQIPPELRKRYYLSSSDFLKQFDDPTIARPGFFTKALEAFGVSRSLLTPKIAALLSPDAELRKTLSPREITALMNLILSEKGLKIHLKHKKFGHNYRFTVVLRGELGSMRDGPEIKAEDTTQTLRTKDLESVTKSSSTDRTASLAFPQLRAIVRAIPHAPMYFVAGPTGTWTKSESVSVNRSSGSNVDWKRGDTLDEKGELGSSSFVRFSSDVTFRLKVLSSSTQNAGLRRVLPGKRGKHVPRSHEVTAAVPPEQLTRTSTLQFVVSKNLTSEQPPPPPREVSPFDPATAREIGPQPLEAASRVPERAMIVSMSGVGEIQDMIKELATKAVNARLKEGAEPDLIFKFEPGAIDESIAHQLSEVAFTDDPSLFIRGKLVTGLDHQRRVGVEQVSVQLSVEPSVDRLDTTVQEYRKLTVEQIASSGFTAGRGRGATGRFQTVFALSPTTFDSPATTDATGATNGAGDPNKNTGFFTSLVLSFAPFSVGKSRNTETGLESTVRFTVEGAAEPHILVHGSLKVTAAVQNIHTNPLLFGLRKPRFARAGGEMTIPVSMWLSRKDLYTTLTDEQRQQLRSDYDTWQLLFGHDFDHLLTEDDTPAPVVPPPPSYRRPEVPASLREGGAARPSLGVGGVSERVDVTGALVELRNQLAVSLGSREAALRLLPERLVEHANDNLRDAQQFLSDVNRSVHQLLNGKAVDPIRLENRFGGQTYDLTLTANLTDVEYAGIEHVDKQKLVNRAKTETKQTRRRDRVIATVSPAVRGMLRFLPASKNGDEAGKATQGNAGLGQRAHGQFGARTRKKTYTTAQQHQTSGQLSGPVLSFGAGLNITASITRRGTVYATTEVSRRVTVNQPLDVSFPAPHQEHLGFTGPSRRLPDTARTRAELEHWRTHRDDGTPTAKLSPHRTQSVEHYFGDVEKIKDAAREALRESGTQITPEIDHALDATINAVLIKADLNDEDRLSVLAKGLSIPLPGSAGRTLELHARMVGSRFASLGGARVDGKGATKDKAESEVKDGDLIGVDRISVPFGAGPQHAGVSHLVNSVYESKGIQASDSSKLTQSATRHDYRTSDPATREPFDDKKDELSQVRLVDLDWAVVVAKTSRPDVFLGGRTFRVLDAAAVRMRNDFAEQLTGEVLPQSLKDAAKELHAKSKELTTAVDEQRGRKHLAEQAENNLNAESRRLAKELDAIDRKIEELPARIEEAERSVRLLRAEFEEHQLSLARGVARAAADEAQRRSGEFGAAPSSPRAALTGSDVHERRTQHDAARARLATAERELQRLKDEQYAVIHRPVFEADPALLENFTQTRDDLRDADAKARAAEDVWWQAKRRYDAAVARKYASDADADMARARNTVALRRRIDEAAGKITASRQAGESEEQIRDAEGALRTLNDTLASGRAWGTISPAGTQIPRAVREDLASADPEQDLSDRIDETNQRIDSLRTELSTQDQSLQRTDDEATPPAEPSAARDETDLTQREAERDAVADQLAEAIRQRDQMLTQLRTMRDVPDGELSGEEFVYSTLTDGEEFVYPERTNDEAQSSGDVQPSGDRSSESRATRRVRFADELATTTAPTAMSDVEGHAESRDVRSRYQDVFGGLTVSLDEAGLDARVEGLRGLVGGEVADRSVQVLGDERVRALVGAVDLQLRELPESAAGLREQLGSLINDVVLGASLVPAGEPAGLTLDGVRGVLWHVGVSLARGDDPLSLLAGSGYRPDGSLV